MGSLANTAWAFATLGLSDAQLFTVLARAAEKRIDDFNSRDLANTAWAFASLGLSDAQLVTVFARAAERHHEFNAQDLAELAWAFATQGERVPELLEPVSVLD